MKKVLLIGLFLSLTINSFCQKTIKEKETLETLDWINSKFTEHQYESNDVKQKCVFIKVEKLSNDQYYLVGRREQIAYGLDNFVLNFKIPISKINNISFIEKDYNYWVEVKLKDNQKKIINYSDKHFYDDVEKIEFMLNKNIDNDNLKSRLIKAFSYLFELYGNIKNDKF